MRLAARVFLIALLTLPLAWTFYAEGAIGREATSSVVIRTSFQERSMIALVAVGWLLNRLAAAAFPELPGWKVDALVWGGVLLGHLWWAS